MKTKSVLLLGIILGIILCLGSCKQAAYGDYYASGACNFTRLNFVSENELHATSAGSGALYVTNYTQNGNEVSFTIGTGSYVLHFNGDGCLVQKLCSTCEECVFCEQ